MNSANNELLKHKLKELENALKASSDEKHALEMRFIDVEKEAFDFKNEMVELKENLDKVKAEKIIMDDKFSTYKSQITHFAEFKNQICEILFTEKKEESPENEKIFTALNELARDKNLIEQRFKELHEEKQKIAAQLKEHLPVDASKEQLETLKAEHHKVKHDLDAKNKLLKDLTSQNKRLEIKYEELEALKIKHDEVQASLQLRQNETLKNKMKPKHFETN